MLSTYLTPSNETIDHQFNRLLLSDLTALFAEIKESYYEGHTSDIRKKLKAVNKVIFDRTGIVTKLTVIDTPKINLMVQVPEIDRNHPLLNDYRRFIYKDDGLQKLKKDDTVLSGEVNRKTSRVSGVFSEVIVPTFVTSGLLKSDLFSGEEVAAMFLHETGHIFTYYEYVSTGLTTNYVLQHVSRELLGTRENKRKYQIIKEFSNTLDVDIDDPETLMASNSEVVIQTVVLRKLVELRQSEMRSPTADLTAWEMLSDQFVSRHGGGRSLVTALDKFNRYGDRKGHVTGWEYHYIESVKLIKVIVGSLVVFAPLTLFYLTAFTDTNESIYDTPKARLERIKRDMVSSLKDADLDRSLTKTITEDIEVVEAILKEMEDKRTYLQFFWSTLRKSGRNNYQQLKFQQDLEVLVNNDLFTKAAILKTIKL